MARESALIAKLENSFKSAVNGSLGVAGTDQERLAFIASHMRAIGQGESPPVASGVADERFVQWVPILEKALSKALGKCIDNGSHTEVLCCVADLLDAEAAAGTAAAPATVAVDWTAAYDRQYSRLGTDAPKRLSRNSRLSRSNAQILEEKSVVEYSEVNGRRSIAQINGYMISKTLGKGAFGEVFLGSKDEQSFAIKVLKRNKVKKSFRGPPGRPGGGGGPAGQASVLESVKAEIATLKKIAHPNCVQLHDVIYEPSDDQVFLVLEYVDGGVSQQAGADGKPIPLPDRTIWSHLRHMLMGLEYLHMHGIVHRDIKPDNLMLTQPNRLYEGDVGVLMITDFGTSTLCEGGAKSQGTVGTPFFFSPELCITAVRDGEHYDTRVVDLWATGVTLYLWCSGRLPFEGFPTVSTPEA